VGRSLDGLFSAIYHRFAFLNIDSDEIGIGADETNRFYTYDIGISGLNDLCTNGTYSGGSYYYNICADTAKKIDTSDYENVFDTLRSSAPSVILWPATDTVDIPPVFFEESPDPLPGISVSGYPVSAEFNTNIFPYAIQINRFELYDVETESALPLWTTMSAQNDPNSHFTDKQFAIFPRNRLEWGRTYYAVMEYTHNGITTQKGWCFSIRSLDTNASRFYRVAEQSATLDVLGDTSYAVYLAPLNENDTFTGYTISSTANISYQTIDRNTLYVTLSGNNGEYAEFSFNNNRTVRLTIASNDTAQAPKATACTDYTFIDTDEDGTIDMADSDDDNDGVYDIQDAFPLDPNEWSDFDNDGVGDNADRDDDNDGIDDTTEIALGLNPKNAADGLADSDGDGFNNTLEIMVGTDFHNAADKPAYTPISNGDVTLFVPYRP